MLDSEIESNDVMAERILEGIRERKRKWEEFKKLNPRPPEEAISWSEFVKTLD